MSDSAVAGFISSCSGAMYCSVPLIPVTERVSAKMDDAEIDDLHRVVVHHEHVAGLEVAVDQPLLVRGLQVRGRSGRMISTIARR